MRCFSNVVLLLIAVSVIASFARAAVGRDECPKCQKPRTYPYGKPWSPPQITPTSNRCAGDCRATMCAGCTQCVTGSEPTCWVNSTCSTCWPCAACSTSAILKDSCPSPVLQGSTAECDAACSRTFRLCIVCPADAIVLIDGKKTQAKGDVREYCLKLPTDKAYRDVDVVALINRNQDVQREVLHVVPDGSYVMFVKSPAAAPPPTATTDDARAGTGHPDRLRSHCRK